MKPTPSPRPETSPSQPETSSCAGLLLRLFWMAAGGLGLGLSAMQLMMSYPDKLGILMACIFGLAALMIAARYADVRFFHGETADGGPATMKHFRAFALRTAVASSALCALAVALGMALQK
jgi:hypothetical protein